MELPLEILEKIFYNNIETLIISQFLNTHIRKLTYNKFKKLDRNLVLKEFTKSICKFKANDNLLVIHIPENYIDDIKYEKRLTNDCFLITHSEYLRIIDYDILYRVSYVYGRKVTSQVHIHPNKMIVKKSGVLHETFILTKDKSLKDICDSKDYIEVNFTLVFDEVNGLY
jgi:hypothetical protein